MSYVSYPVTLISRHQSYIIFFKLSYCVFDAESRKYYTCNFGLVNQLLLLLLLLMLVMKFETCFFPFVCSMISFVSNSFICFLSTHELSQSIH